MSRAAGTVFAWIAVIAELCCCASAAPDADLAELRARGNTLFARGEMPAAAEAYEQGYREARAAGNIRFAARFLNNAAGSRLALFQFRAAMAMAMEARALAGSAGDAQIISAACANLSSIHAQMGDSEAALLWAKEALQYIGPGDPWGTRGQVAALYADQLAASGRLADALPWYQDAIATAERRSDMRVIAQLWDHYGEALLNGAQDMNATETALLRAYLIRVLLHVPGLQESLLNLSRLRLAQGDAATALALVREAALTHDDTAMPAPWMVPWIRAEAELALQRRREARSDLRSAVAIMRDWSAGFAPADAIRVRGAREFQHIYDRLIEEDMAEGAGSWAEAFQMNEQSRANSMRRTLAFWSGWKTRLPDEYWRVLYQLRGELSAARPDVGKISAFRIRLREMEAETIAEHVPVENTSRERTTPQETLTDVQRKLTADEAFFSFHVGRQSSWVWAVTRSGLVARRLPGDAELTGLIRPWIRAVQHSMPQRDEVGRRLYQTIFADFGRDVESKPTWVIAADDQIFEMPFSALVVNSGGPPVYMVERHATRVIPGVLLEAARDNSAENADGFVGIGDAIYNSADERVGPAFMSAAFLSAGVRPELPRLAASSAELRTADAAWKGSPSTLLTGPDATRRKLIAALATKPAVVHIASHVLHPTEKADDAVLDFGRGRAGAPEVLAVEDIASFDLPQSTVVMSGCASAAASSAAGAGVLGLTRAWFLAGARAVVGSKWDTTDNNGELFGSFYRHLRQTSRSVRRGAAARAMQLARLEMLRSRSWQAAPAYWAAFYVVEKE